MAFDPVVMANGFCGVLAGSGLVALWVRSREERMRVLEAEVDKLRERTLREVQERLERHVAADRSQEFTAKLETVIAQNNEIMFELKKLNRESAAQGTTVARTEQSLHSLWDKFDACRQSHRTPGSKD